MSDHGAKPEEHGAEGEAKPKKSKKGLFIGIGVAVLSLGAGVPMFMMGGEPPPDESATHEEEEHHHEKHLETAELGVFIVNLSETTSFLKTKMTVEFDPEIVDRQTKKPEGEEAAKEEGGGGHGCGHNLFGAGSLGAAIAIKEQIAAGKLKGTVIFYGTPAEEDVGGKAYMVRDGLFDGVDAVIAWHPSDETQADLTSSQAMVDLSIEFHGKSAHAAYDPWNARSAEVILGPP